MTLLFVLSNPQSKPALKGLIGACDRAQVDFMCFFTGAGVAMLADTELTSLLAAAERAVVCEHAWGAYAPDDVPPIDSGSQTDHSAMIGSVAKVISL